MRLIFSDEIFKVFIDAPGAQSTARIYDRLSRLRVTASRSASRPPDRLNASGECLQVFSDLQCYTVAKQDPAFIHQHAVDAYEAQHAGGATRNITVAFGLIGLYLALEKGYTGRQVQLAHMSIAKTRKNWPRLEPPDQPAFLTVMDVLSCGNRCGERCNNQEVDGRGMGNLGRPACMGPKNNR